jgi:hypothetical protein
MNTASDVLAAADLGEGGFVAYIAFLGLSGLLLIALAVQPFLKSSMGLRIINGLVGLGFLGYAIYLFFIFDGGTYSIFIYAFIAPVLLLIQTIRAARAQNA